MSGLSNDRSDALCRLATGTGYATRKLYTDNEQQVFELCRPFICNGITGIAERPDLIDRSIALNFPSMDEGNRKLERHIEEEIEKIKPQLLGKLFEIASYAIEHLDSVEPPKGFRMASGCSQQNPRQGYQQGLF